MRLDVVLGTTAGARKTGMVTTDKVELGRLTVADVIMISGASVKEDML